MFADHKGEIPFAVFLLPFMLGIGFALSFDLSAAFAFLQFAFFGICLAFVLLRGFYNRLNLYRYKTTAGLLIHLLLLTAGMVCATGFSNRMSADYFEKTKADQLIVHVIGEPQFKANMLRFTAEVVQRFYQQQANAASGKLLLTLRTDSAHGHSVRYGDELLIPAKLAPVDPPFNPAEFNYQQYLAHQNIFAQAFLNPSQWVVVAHHTANPLTDYALGLRQRLVDRFKSGLQNPDAIAVASTLILGYKADLSEDILQAYTKTGTVHVLSVSGSHVAIIFALIGYLFGFFDRIQHGRIIKGVIAISLIWAYAMLTGFSPAVCRAAVMISMIIIGKAYNRQINSLNLLALSAFVQLLWNPFLLSDVGFQLSYLSVTGLIVFQPLIYRLWDPENKWLDKVWLFCSASVAAQVITFPLSAYYFHQFPVYFLLSNLFIIPLSELIMFAGIGFLTFSFVPYLGDGLAVVLEKAILIMNKGLTMIEHSPYASIDQIWITRLDYLLLYVLVLLLFYFIYSRKPVLLKASLVCMLFLSVSLSAKNIRTVNDSHITFYNLKKHEGILFKAGADAVLLTDLADTDKNYQYALKPGLDSARIRHLIHCPLNRDTATRFFRKQGHLIQFLDQRLVLFDRSMAGLMMTTKLKVDYVYVSGSPHADLNSIARSYDIGMLIIGSNNSDKSIKTLSDSAVTHQIKNKLLKRNYCLIVQSN